MPSLTIPAALLQLTVEGVPWDYPAWQEATGVYHGLFSDDPGHLPKGWTKQDASDIRSFISRYCALDSEEKKATFLSEKRGTVLPGRKKWQNWVNSIWRSSGLQDKIISVFNARNCHPLTLWLAAPKSKDRRMWPAGGTWIPSCLNDIAIEIYGDECLNELDHLPEEYRPATQAIVQRTWTGLTRRLHRAYIRAAALEEEATKSFNALTDQTLDEAAITAVIRAVAKWRNVVEVLKTKENLDKIERMEIELNSMMEELGADVGEEKKNRKNTKSPAPRLSSVSNDMLRTLATEEAIQDVIALYHEFFNNPSNEIDDVPVIDRQASKIPFGDLVDDADLGTEYEADKSRAELSSNLGFVQELPLLFNNYRHTAGVNRWVVPDIFTFDDPTNPPPEVRNLELHWHQLAGVHAILRACFTETPIPGHCTGMLIADEVGLGKTYQTATVIACLADAAIRKREHLRLPPLLGEIYQITLIRNISLLILSLESRPYLAGKKDIPSLPHLILVPGTLTTQWLDELRITFQPGGVDIFVYPTAQADRLAFWDANSAFYLSKQPSSSKIIISTHSVSTAIFP
ncbi:hypothetical protein BDN70DRAFT_818120 [Pholiota conissans]|uniref:SNF2 N-terminal domain-containing protein n=1 Tax=Pholiota conissans TaxID=109636 RepID=A0A9P6CT94_9AGAR|nr:hypothetical protein BDN70DRAFT_818120 [Pholiota conissans]